MVGCINLRERFRDRFKVTCEESYFAEYGPHARVEDPVYMLIPCRKALNRVDTLHKMYPNKLMHKTLLMQINQAMATLDGWKESVK